LAARGRPRLEANLLVDMQ